MTTFFLVRHAAHELGPDVLPGRKPGVRLSAEGRAQAERLAERLKREAVTALHTSPQPRALETARPIAAGCGVEMQIAEALDEVDFGVWSGRRFDDLERDPAWAAWNAERAHASTPAGETIESLDKRVIGHIEGVCAGDPSSRIVLVSHAEPIRTAILHYIGLPYSAFTRLEIGLASLSRLILTGQSAVLAGLNEAAAP